MNNSDPFLRRLIYLALTASLLIGGLSVIPMPRNAGIPPGISLEMGLFPSDTRQPALNLETADTRFRPYRGEELKVRERFAYLWVTIANTGDEARELMLGNGTRNYYTELLRPGAIGAVTLYRQGDTVPADSWPVLHNKPLFPITVPPRSRENFILEFHGPRGIAVAPRLLTPAEALSHSALDRGISGGLYGAGAVLVLLLFSAGLLLGFRHFIPAGLFSFSLILFSLRQSRLLLLVMTPLVYPEWLYPLTVFLNIAAAVFLAADLLGEDLKPLLRYSVLGILTAGGILTAVSFFLLPYLMADLLNLAGLVILVLLIAGCRDAHIRGKNRMILPAVTALLPWVTMMILDILMGYLGVRGGLADYRQLLGILAAFLLLILVFFHYREEDSSDRLIAHGEPRLPEPGTAGILPEQEISFEAGYSLDLALDGILASARHLAREFADPRVVAVTRGIILEAAELKERLVRPAGAPPPFRDHSGEGLPDTGGAGTGDTGEPEPWPASAGTENGRVLLYQQAGEENRQLRIILRSEGFRTESARSSYEILNLIEKGEADVLVMDPSSMGESVFTLCALIRSRRNLLQMPVLLLVGLRDSRILQKGYAAGVNDFLIRPFEASELTARVQSLIKLKEVAFHNRNLAQSEKEKNAFLYFLTHNINTPLTLLINRIRELEAMEGDEEMREITDDLSASSREISDIVRNVMISFRLADGRQTTRIEDVDIRKLILEVEEDLLLKAEEKSQELTAEIPGGPPLILQGDSPAIRGILYNLADNAIKFTPRGGTVRILLTIQDPLRIEVADSGPGIPREEEALLFERFEKLSPRPTGGESSTGLGLYVARELARLNGGNLAYLPGNPGSRFILTLPLPGQPAEE